MNRRLALALRRLANRLDPQPEPEPNYLVDYTVAGHVGVFSVSNTTAAPASVTIRSCGWS